MTHVLSVPHHGTTLFLVDHNDEPWTPLSPVMRLLGLDMEPVFEWTRSISCLSARTLIIAGIDVVTESLCIPLRKLYGWLCMLEHYVGTLPAKNGIDDTLWIAWRQRNRAQALPFNGRILLNIENGKVSLAQQVPDHWLVAPLDGFHEISSRAGYHVTHQTIHDLLYEAKF